MLDEMRLRDSDKFTDEVWKMAKKLGYDKYLEQVRRDVLDEDAEFMKEEKQQLREMLEERRKKKGKPSGRVILWCR